jgi:hypothetical protein
MNPDSPVSPISLRLFFEMMQQAAFFMPRHRLLIAAHLWETTA